MKKPNVIYGIEGVEHLFPDEVQTKGVATISKYEFSSNRDPLYNLRAARDGNYFMRMHDGKYVRLHVGKELQMSDTGMERTTNAEFIQRANGRVLIAGLGIGLVLQNILKKPEVKFVVVVEKYQDVIDLVQPYFHHPKLRIECADINEYQPEPGTKFDTIYFDIWPSISTDNLEEMTRLHRKFRKFLNKENPNHYMNSWMRDFLRKQRRKEQREERRGSYWW